jgi:hypothetical protein
VRDREFADSPLEESGFAQACNNNGIDWQTGLSAEIDTKGVSGAVANLPVGTAGGRARSRLAAE